MQALRKVPRIFDQFDHRGEVFLTTEERFFLFFFIFFTQLYAEHSLLRLPDGKLCGELGSAVYNCN